jgi:hypothetical protein
MNCRFNNPLKQQFFIRLHEPIPVIKKYCSILYTLITLTVTMNKTYVAIHLDFIAMIILVSFIILSLGRGLSIGDWMAVSPQWVSLTVHALVILSVLRLGFRRNTYLPFLGQMVFPCKPMEEKIPKGANASVEVLVQPDSNVIYWASFDDSERPDDSIIASNPIHAYQEYENSGVVRSDKNGRAVLKVRTPVAYKLPFGKVLKPHVHYRVCGEGGILGRVETVYAK